LGWSGLVWLVFLLSLFGLLLSLWLVCLFDGWSGRLAPVLSLSLSLSCLAGLAVCLSGFWIKWTTQTCNSPPKDQDLFQPPTRARTIDENVFLFHLDHPPPLYNACIKARTKDRCAGEPYRVLFFFPFNNSRRFGVAYFVRQKEPPTVAKKGDLWRINDGISTTVYRSDRQQRGRDQVRS
jgi:hypothetical protein